jgi:hypothetical protein
MWICADVENIPRPKITELLWKPYFCLSHPTSSPSKMKFQLAQTPEIWPFHHSLPVNAYPVIISDMCSGMKVAYELDVIDHTRSDAVKDSWNPFPIPEGKYRDLEMKRAETCHGAQANVLNKRF